MGTDRFVREWLQSRQPCRAGICRLWCSREENALFQLTWRRKTRLLRYRCSLTSCTQLQLSAELQKDTSEGFWRNTGGEGITSFGESPRRLPTQGESVVRGVEPSGLQLQERDRAPADVDFLSVSSPTSIEVLEGHMEGELIAIQQNGPKSLGFFGTRNMGFLHQNLIEVLSYAMVLTGNHIFTSGATGTNAAVIRGALRAENPDLLTVVLPQSLRHQPPESQELLAEVKAENLIEMPQNDELTLLAASRICNRDIVNRVQQVICFAFHDSNLLLETCEEAKTTRKIVTLFYLD